MHSWFLRGWTGLSTNIGAPDFTRTRSPSSRNNAMKLERAGLSPDDDLPESEWPEDMRVDSGTSVET